MTTAPTSCKKCGRQAGTASQFQRGRCMDCASATIKSRNSQTAFVHLAILAGGLYLAVNGWSGILGFAIVFLALLDLVAIVTTIVHEASHAATAAALRLPVKEISIGLGPQLARFKVRGLRIILRLLPMNGHVAYVPQSGATRTRALLTTLAGPLSHIPLAMWIGSIEVQQANVEALQGSAVRFVLILAAVNIIPFGNTDGKRLVQLISMSDQQVEGMTALGEVVEALTPLTENQDPAGVTPDQREALLAHLANPEIAPAERALSLNNLAVVDLFLEDPDLMAEADSASAEAMRLMPDVAAIRNTRGAVLIRLGNFVEGIELMEPTMSQIPNGARGSSHCELGFAYASLGKPFDARRHLSAALSSGYRHHPFQAATRRLGELEVAIARNYVDEAPPAQAAAAFQRDAGRDAVATGMALTAHIEASGQDGDLAEFAASLIGDAPPNARGPNRADP